jgi:hypothetical protein
MRAFPLLTIAEGRLAQNDGAGAERAARDALAILRDALPAGHYAIAVAECRIGAGLAQQQRTVEAAPLINAALEALTASGQAPDRFVSECAAARAALR